MSVHELYIFVGLTPLVRGVRRNSVGCNDISTYYGGLIIIPLKYATLCILS